MLYFILSLIMVMLLMKWYIHLIKGIYSAVVYILELSKYTTKLYEVIMDTYTYIILQQ